MELGKKKQTELLNYAIKRINSYDKLKEPKLIIYAIDSLPGCNGCTMADREANGCAICPFNMQVGDGRFSSLLYECRPPGWGQKTVKQHQKRLIKALKNWCKKFKVPFEIEEFE